MKNYTVRSLSHSCSVQSGGLIYSLSLLRRGQKKKGYCVVLISVGMLLSFAAYLSISE